MPELIGAYFETQLDADSAVSELRAIGVPDDQLTVIGKHGLPEEQHAHYVGAAAGVPAASVARGAGIGLLAGTGIGALAGLGSIFFPPLLPFAFIGWAAPTASAMAIGAAGGAIIGGTVGTLAGILREAQFTPHEAEFYAGELERGGALVGVNLDGGISESGVRQIFARHGGRFAPEASTHPAGG